MKGLILKDLYNLRKYGKTVLLISALYIIIIFMLDSAEVFMGTIVLMFAAMSVTTQTYDTQSGWDVYVNTLPVSRRDIVKSKYILSYMLALAGSLLALLVGWINGLIKNVSNFTDTLVTSYVLLGVAVVFLSIIMPLIYKFGEERSRVIIIAIVAIPFAAFFLLDQTGAIVMPDERTIMQALLLSPVVLIVLSFISFVISRALYHKKEI